jgi:glycosyltransferase involved in cell wall biosynthesis
MMDSPIENQDFVPAEAKENLITMIARLDQDKNVLEFLEIIKEADLPSDWQVNIIGDGPEMPVLKRYVEDNSLSNVFLLGQLDSDNVRAVISKSKINCLTSLREGFGVVLVEAMFSSNALIAYDCPSGPSEIVNEKNGFLIPLRNKNEFKDKLKFLIQNPATLTDLMRSSYSESKNWKKNLIIDQWDFVLNDIK